MSSPALREKSTIDPSPEINLDHIGRLGLLAGEGNFPLLIARAARDRGVSVSAFGIKGVTPVELQAEVDAMHWVEMGQFQKLINLFHAGGISKIVMVGRVKHNSIFQLPKFDLRGLKMMASLVNKKADTILGAITRELKKDNIDVLDSTLFLRSMMPGKGLLTRTAPNEEIRRDLQFGYEQAKAIAGLDIGQTVVVKSQSVVAVEAMEGTDKTIERAGQVAGSGIVVVKVSKPMQDKRFDVPILGLRTIQKLVEAKGAALGFSAGETLLFDQAESVALADANGIVIFGI